jgi:hypothetical protein
MTRSFQEAAIESPPPAYETPIMTSTDEKHSNVHLVTRYLSTASATSTICPSSTCPSKRPMSYSSTPQSRKRSCGGCCQKSSTSAAAALTAPQVLSTSFMLLNNALSGTAMEKPASRDDAEANIQAFKTVLREVKRLRQGCHLSCKEKKTLERELRPMEDEVKGVLKDLKREESRISRSNQRML